MELRSANGIGNRLLSLLTHPMIKTQPSGSFRMIGLRNLFEKGMSGAVSSLAHCSKLRVTKTQSLLHHPVSVRYVSKPPLPKSFLHASAIACSLSERL